MSDPREAPAIADILRFLQTKAGIQCRIAQPGDRIGFALSSKDRISYTRQTVEAMDTDGGYDLIWIDGSDQPKPRDLPKNFHFRNAPWWR
jgi:hypothetical protein